MKGSRGDEEDSTAIRERGTCLSNAHPNAHGTAADEG